MPPTLINLQGRDGNVTQVPAAFLCQQHYAKNVISLCVCVLVFYLLLYEGIHFL